MDEAGIDMQVISFALRYSKNMSPSEDVSDARTINDMLSRIAEKYPERLAFYTSLPMLDPDAAVDELERAVKNLGLKGPMIFSGSDGSYVDERKFWGIYGMAEKLDVPVYIHPGTLLPEKVRLTAPSLIGEEDFKIGSEMEMEISTLWTEDDFDIIGYKFKAV